MLLYYYAFLNLAKATLEAHGRTYQGAHGLTARPNVAVPDLSLQDIEVRTTGIFPGFYEQQFGTPLPANIRLNLRALLAYVTDIGFQYDQCGFGSAAVFGDCFGRLLSYAPSNIGWVTIAVDRNYDFSLLPEPNRSTFDATYQEVTMPKDRARDSFGIFAEALRAYRFYEMRTPIDTTDGVNPGILVRCLCYPLHGFIEPPLIENTGDFALSRPLTIPADSFVMNEATAIYLSTFFLGSLVRYHPYYLEDLLGSNASWLLESFTESAPLTLLRWFLGSITGVAYIFNK